MPAGRATPGAPRPCLAAGAARGFPLGGSRGKGAALGPLSQGSILLGLGLVVLEGEWGFSALRVPWDGDAAPKGERCTAAAELQAGGQNPTEMGILPL